MLLPTISIHQSLQAQILPDLDVIVSTVIDSELSAARYDTTDIVTVGGPVPFIARDGEDGPIVQWVGQGATHRPLGVKPEGARWVELAQAVCDRRHCDE